MHCVEHRPTFERVGITIVVEGHRVSRPGQPERQLKSCLTAPDDCDPSASLETVFREVCIVPPEWYRPMTDGADATQARLRRRPRDP